MKKKLPTLKSDKDAENFIENSDLTEYDLSGAKQVRFEFQNGQIAGIVRSIFSYSVSGATSAPFGQLMVPPFIIAFLKKLISYNGLNIGPLSKYSLKSTSPLEPSSNSIKYT